MDASRYNSPSRKSRFRSQSGTPYRPAAPTDGPAPLEEEASAEPEEEVYAETAPVEAEAADPLATGALPEEELYAADQPAAEAPPEDESLPAGLRLTRSADAPNVQRRGVPGWVAALASLGCLLLGGVGAYLLQSHGSAAASTATANRAATERTAPVIPLAPAVLGDVDAAFAANKAGQFTDARLKFGVLASSHPDWASMRIEAARSALYEHDFDGAKLMLSAVERAGANVDASLLTGLLQMTIKSYDKAELAFAQAVAIDPSRPDVFFFWGECLRREGRPQDAAEKFHQALLRNQYETTEGLYQLKLWLSEIQADQEAAKSTNAKIDADLASGHPSGPALFAAAAREIKAGKLKEAGAHIGQAQKVMEPAVFRVILQDPTFLEQDLRPELAPFYHP